MFFRTHCISTHSTEKKKRTSPGEIITTATAKENPFFMVFMSLSFIPFFVFCVLITHEPELIYCVISFNIHIQKRPNEREKKKAIDESTQTSIKTHCNILDLRHSKAYRTLLHTLLLLFLEHGFFYRILFFRAIVFWTQQALYCVVNLLLVYAKYVLDGIPLELKLWNEMMFMIIFISFRFPSFLLSYASIRL